MKAALLFGVRDLRLIELPRPDVTRRTVLVKVQACGICPTDLRKFNTLDGGALKLPANLGHEFVGTVVEIGEAVENFMLGMRVMGDGYVGYAEYALMDLDSPPPVHVPRPITIPDNVSDYAATFAEPLADCVHAVLDQAALRSRGTILIIGGGTMGQLLMMVAKESGGHVIMSEPDAGRRAMALSLGADVVIDPESENVIDRIRYWNGNHLVDATILTIGVPSLVPFAMSTVRPQGRVVLFGGFPHPAKIEIDPNLIHYSEITVLGSEWVGVAPYSNIDHFRKALKLIEADHVPVERLISGIYPLSEITKAFNDASRLDNFKLIVVP